ncbi:MAG: DUF1365 domain-containing protein [Candidatus Hydrogenedentota bacterium]|nr:MAG: DUF1365 domain-containing protein [Candidatus Hydrogenedentota bacterium]
MNTKKWVKSCVYEGRVWHARDFKVKNYFSYRIFLWHLDLDEIMQSRSSLISYNKLGLFSFREKDHGLWDPRPLRVKQKLYEIATDLNLPIPQRICILTHLRVMGYVFNPVSFYFFYDKNEKPYACFAEVNNTFGEQKLVYLSPTETKDTFETVETKNFYVSPFISHDAKFHFKAKAPSDSLNIRTDSLSENGVELKAGLVGKQKPISTKQIWYLFFRYPLITWRIIYLIHKQALKLYLKRLPYYKKAEVDVLIKQQKGKRYATTKK